MEKDIEILEQDLDDILDCLRKKYGYEYAQIIGIAIDKLYDLIKADIVEKVEG